ncbi:type IV secretory system conjugative DNA transfer family protein [Histidinibacterium aquaticum]|uniref:TraM recognition domain-containing protein n=1 Tax=Histidinibacterium aquaticum TaxID=2613962 RepID=A0A5J5GDP0_9RHOB|nr:type IV secretory system conjugative DNA transfer family protein [Histidinibacterium aquaticum]KAA9005574.1 TraM recognition domain-containing protein [Histidinibacterium aquaticum]
MTHYQLPPKISEPGLLVGYSQEDDHIRQPVGFSFGTDEFSPRSGYLDPYIFHGEGHLMTIAPTGAGKGVSCVIPAALRHEGDLVVMDPKGENYAVTAARRKALGQQIYLIDPFGVTEDWEGRTEPDASGLNLFDLLPYLSDDTETAAQSMAGMLAPGEGSGRDFWDISAQNILAGLIAAYHELGQGLDRMLEDLRTRPDQVNRTEQRDYFPDLAAAPAPVRITLDRSGLDCATALDLFLVTLRTHRDVAGDEASNQTEPDEDLVLLEQLFDDSDGGAWRTADADLLATYKDCLGTAFYAQFGAALEEVRPGSAISPVELRTLAAWAMQVLPGVVDAPSRASERLPMVFDETETVGYPLAVLKMFASRGTLASAVSAQCAQAPNRTFGSMMATLEGNISYLQSRGVRSMLSSPGFDLERFRQGRGSSVYIVFPPHKLGSHSRLLATIFKGLINVICARRSRPPRTTLFLMDEVAQLGHMEEFVAAKTLLRGYGVQVWSFWQDLSQLRACYPANWETLINNCKVFQAFGCATPLQASALVQMFDLPPAALLDMEHDEMLLAIYGDEPVFAKKPSYFSDPAFDGAYRDNPLHARDARTSGWRFVEVAEDRPLRPSNAPGRPLGRVTAAE